MRNVGCTKLEWLLPEKVRTNQDINNLVSHVLAPLNLPDGEVDATKLTETSISNLGKFDEVTIGVARFEIWSGDMAKEVCDALVKCVYNFRRDTGRNDLDKVTNLNEVIQSSRNLGVVSFFGNGKAVAQAAAAAASATSSSAATAPSSSHFYAPSMHAAPPPGGLSFTGGSTGIN